MDTKPKAPSFDDPSENWEEDSGRAEDAFHNKDSHPHELIADPITGKQQSGVLVGIYRHFRLKLRPLSKASTDREKALLEAGGMKGKVLEVARVPLVKWVALEQDEYRTRFVWSGKGWICCHLDDATIRFEVVYRDAANYPAHIRMRILQAGTNKEMFSVLVQLNGPNGEGKIALQ